MGVRSSTRKKGLWTCCRPREIFYICVMLFRRLGGIRRPCSEVCAVQVLHCVCAVSAFAARGAAACMCLCPSFNDEKESPFINDRLGQSRDWRHAWLGTATGPFAVAVTTESDVTEPLSAYTIGFAFLWHPTGGLRLVCRSDCLVEGIASCQLDTACLHRLSVYSHCNDQCNCSQQRC